MLLIKKLLKVIAIVIAAAGVLYVLLPIGVNAYLNNNADRIVSDMITRTSDFAGHHVRFGDIHFNYDFTGTVLRLRDVAISPGEEVSDLDKIRFNLSLKEANLTGFRWIDFLLNNSIRLDSAHLEDLMVESITPPLEVLKMTNGDGNSGESRDYNRIYLNHIRINKFNFFNKDSHTDSTRLNLKDLFVFADGMDLTKEHLANPDALFDVDHIQGYMDEATLHLNEYRNALTAKDLSFDTDDRKLYIDNVRLKNKLEKYEYINQFEKETDWMELHQAKVELQHMDFIAYFNSGQIHGKRLHVTDAILEVFRDKRKPEDREKRPKMIHEIFKTLGVDLRIDTVCVENMQVSYEERPDNEAPRAGKIFFDELNAKIFPVTTFEEDLEANDTLELQAEARLMGLGKINLTNRYFLLDEKGSFTMKGSIGGFDMKVINQMVEPATRVALKSGKLNSLYFNIKGNDYDGHGELVAKYDDLEIEILDKNFGHDQNIFQRIGSFLANKLVIKSQNPTRRGELLTGAVYEVRDQSKFIFNYWWKLILSGLKSTITGDTEEDLREKAKNN